MNNCPGNTKRMVGVIILRGKMNRQRRLCCECHAATPTKDFREWFTLSIDLEITIEICNDMGTNSVMYCTTNKSTYLYVNFVF